MQHAVPGRAPPHGRSGPLLPVLCGWLLVGLADAVAVAVRARSSPARDLVPALLYVVGHALALGFLAFGAAEVWRRLHRVGRWRWLGAVGLASLFVWGVVGDDLAGLRRVLPAWLPFAGVALAVALVGTGLFWLALWGLGRLERRRWPALACLVAGVALSAANATNLPASYLALHLLALIVAGWFAARGLSWLAAHRPVDPRLQRVALALAASGAAIALLRAPSNNQLLLLLREPGASLAPYLAELRPALPASQRIPEGQREWFRDRSGLPAIPPSKPPLLQSPVVILLGIDSMRADLLVDSRRQADLPQLHRLRAESIHFSNARSPGSSTGPALATVFSGLYYSQLYWSHRDKPFPDVFPHEDPNPRFPQLLADAGVTTVTFDGIGFLRNEHGIVRGFREERSARSGSRYASSEAMINAAIERLERVGREPLFMFIHLPDAHSPYNRAGARATPFEGYVAELGLVDRELARLRQALERPPLRDRAVLMVVSDHGEAFGEHGLTWHGLTVYDELLRVPFLVWTAAGRPTTIPDPVSLIDLGPTILDLMGVPTPARFMGQSLVPYLRGEQPVLTRPILAEARLKRALVTPEGMKIIYDTQTQTVEVFDLRRDPGEERNLFGTTGDELLGVLRTFYQVHTLDRPGYRVPYRRW